jgi:hypothetical protein
MGAGRGWWQARGAEWAEWHRWKRWREREHILRERERERERERILGRRIARDDGVSARPTEDTAVPSERSRSRQHQ